MIDVYLYEADGTTEVEQLTATEARIEVDGTRGVRRTASFTVPASELAELKVYDRIIKMTDRTSSDTMFTGYYDDIVATANLEESSVKVACRDKSKALKEPGFTEDETYEDETATDTGQLISSVSATTELSSGYEIQGYADVYEQTVTVYDLGVARRVNDAVVTGDIRDGDLSITASGSNVQKVVLDVYLDLKTTEDLEQILIDHGGYADLMEVSADTVSWATYTSGTTTCRYIHIQITGILTFEAEVHIYAGTSYPANNVLTDNDASWRPSLSDLTREITLNCGSAKAANVLYTRWALNDAERRTLVHYEVLAQVSSYWVSLGTWYANAGLSEAVFDEITAQYFKIRVLSTWEGRPALRYAELKKVVATDTVDQVIETIATAEGETAFALIETKMRVNVTFEAGLSIWDALQRVVSETLGNWSLYYTPDGVLTLEPVVLRTDSPRTVTALLPPFTVTYSDPDVKNEVVAIFEDRLDTLRAVATNENAASSTSIPRIGRRTVVVKSSLADSEAKLAIFAQRVLATRGRVTVPAQATIAADPDIDAWDIWQVTESKTETDGLFILTAFSIVASYEQATYDLSARLEAI